MTFGRALFLAPPEPAALPDGIPTGAIVWRRLDGESVEDALARYAVAIGGHYGLPRTDAAPGPSVARFG